jgi:cell division protein FtsB
MRKLLLFLMIVLGFLQFRLWFGDSNLLELEAIKQHMEELKQRAHERKERNAVLEAEVMDLKHGTDAIEEHARFDLGMIREGEHLILALESLPPEDAPPETKKANRPPPAPKTKHKRPPKAVPHIDTETPAETGDHDTLNNQKTSDE